jgi:hypothetical protein
LQAVPPSGVCRHSPDGEAQKSCVQSFASSQESGVWTQPAAASQLSVVHGFPSSQFNGWPPAQIPAAQLPAVMQAPCPVEQAWPSGLGVWEQARLGQVSSVQGLPSLQGMVNTPMQPPRMHSISVQLPGGVQSPVVGVDTQIPGGVQI